MSVNVRYWRKWGFLPIEQNEYKTISRAGIKAPYAARMIRRRIAIQANAKRYGWTNEQLEDYIIRKEYGGRTPNTSDVWQYFRRLEESTPQRADEYESPWKKRKYDGDNRRKPQTTDGKPLTRRGFIMNQIKAINEKITGTSNDKQIEQLIKQRNDLWAKLNSLK